MLRGNEGNKRICGGYSHLESSTSRVFEDEQITSSRRPPLALGGNTQDFEQMDMSRNQNPVLLWSTQNHVQNYEGGRNGRGLPLTNLHLPGFGLWRTWCTCCLCRHSNRSHRLGCCGSGGAEILGVVVVANVAMRQARQLRRL